MRYLGMKLDRAGQFLLLLSAFVHTSFLPYVPLSALKLKAHAALSYCRQKGYNTKMALLCNMSIHSGKNRFYIYNLVTDSVMASGLVSHGCGSQPWGYDYTKEQPVFSNADGSHCTSLGKYKTGERSYSQWGIKVKYLLYGLEKSNSHALRRTIVLHSWDEVPGYELYPDGTPEGWGCPALSNRMMRTLDPLLKNSGKPVLLWVYQ